MKKLLIIIIVFTTVFSGCRYKEGPLISFRSVEKRIKGTWEIVGLTSDGIDSLQYYNDTCGCVMQLSLNTDSGEGKGFLDFKYGKRDFYASFQFADYGSKTKMKVDFGNGTKIIGPIGKGFSLWKILKLENKKLKISTNCYGRNYIISFKKE